MAKGNNEPKKEKQPRDFSKAVTVVKVIALFVLALASLQMAGMLQISDFFAKVLGYALMVVTLYFALSSVK